MKNQEKGKLGEHYAADFLQQKGFELIAQNYRQGRKEIDLIAKKENVLHFVEVKTRKNDDFGLPEAFVSEAQATRIAEAADHFLESIAWTGFIQFDIISILLDKEEIKEIVHLEDVF